MKHLLQAYKRKEVALLAQEFKESNDAFFEANPGALRTPLSDLLQ